MTKNFFKMVPLFVFALGCGGSTDKPVEQGDKLTEKDKTEVVDRPIDNAPGMSLVFTRTRDDGWRKVELKMGKLRYPFHTDTSRYMLDAAGEGFGDRAVICGMSTPDVQEGTNLDITCAVADGTGLGELKQITSPTSAWIGDVCVDAGDKVTVLYTTGTKPLDPEASPDVAPCMALAWDPTSGWASSATPSATCACKLRDGTSCTDPCFVGAGVNKNGTCDTSGLVAVCNDGDPATDDFCTGKVNPDNAADKSELCYAVPRM